MATARQTKVLSKLTSNKSDMVALARSVRLEYTKIFAVWQQYGISGDPLPLTWSEYIPHEPSSKQVAFMVLPHREALYGGAAGGGKSDALLMCALQYAHVPGYSAIIFRKRFTDLKLPDSLIPRSMQWLGGTDARWDGSQNMWTFPSGATLAFGYIGSDVNLGLTKTRYQGSAYQSILWDETTQMQLDDYLYLFSRLRRPKCQRHIGKLHHNCRACIAERECGKIPLRVRGATNPGGVGGIWVKERFAIGPDNRGHNPDRPFIQAFVTDNPGLDVASYRESLSNLDPVTRRQLLEGDWSIMSEGRFRRSWFRYYTVRGDNFCLGKDGQGEFLSMRDCFYFSTVDPAASAREGPGDESIFVRKQPSYTVIATWAVTPSSQLLLVDLLRFRREVPDVLRAIHAVNEQWHPSLIGVEVAGMQVGIAQLLEESGLPIHHLKPASQDKLVRATDAMNRMERGLVWFPQTAIWLDDLETELLQWTGHPHQTADQIDALAYAAMMVSGGAGRPAESHVPMWLPSRGKIDRGRVLARF